jgi:hypothetical protein
MNERSILYPGSRSLNSSISSPNKRKKVAAIIKITPFSKFSTTTNPPKNHLLKKTN